MTWKDFDILTQRRSSRPLTKHDAACDPHRKPSLLWSWEHTRHEFQRFVRCVGQWLSSGWPKVCSGSANHRRVHAQNNVSTPMVSTQSKCRWRHDEVQESTFGTIVHVAAHWNVHVERRKIPSWRIPQICDRLEQYHETQWAQSEPWLNAPFLFTCHRIEGISFQGTWGRSHVDYGVCYSTNRPCHDCRLLTFTREGPYSVSL